MDQHRTAGLQDAPAQFTGAQAQVDVAKAYGQALVEAADGFEAVSAHQQAGCGDGRDFARHQQRAPVADISRSARNFLVRQKLAEVLGGTKHTHANASVLHADAVSVDQVGPDDAHAWPPCQAQHGVQPTWLECLDVVVAEQQVRVVRAQLAHRGVVDGREIEGPAVTEHGVATLQCLEIGLGLRVG